MKRRQWMQLSACALGSATTPVLRAQGLEPAVGASPATPIRFESLLVDLPLNLKKELQDWAPGGMPVMTGLTLELPELVDNGNDVRLRVAVESPMTPQHHVRRLALWAPRNPQALVLEAVFTPLVARAELVTRIRLSSTQRLLALAELSNGEVRCAAMSVLVALAACIEA